MPAILSNGVVEAGDMALHADHVNGFDEMEPDSEDERMALQQGTNGHTLKINASNSEERKYHAPPSSFSIPKQNGFNEQGQASSEKASVVTSGGMADFFSSEVFRIVLHNPATAHRLSKFCQARLCGENMEFLEKVIITNVPSGSSRRLIIR